MPDLYGNRKLQSTFYMSVITKVDQRYWGRGNHVVGHPVSERIDDQSEIDGSRANRSERQVSGREGSRRIITGYELVQSEHAGNVSKLM